MSTARSSKSRSAAGTACVRTGLVNTKRPPGFNTIAATRNKASIKARKPATGTRRPIGGLVIMRSTLPGVTHGSRGCSRKSKASK